MQPQIEDLIDEMTGLKKAYNEQVAVNTKLQILQKQSADDKELRLERAVNRDLNMQLQYILENKDGNRLQERIGYSNVQELQEKNEQLLRAIRLLSDDFQTLTDQPDLICSLQNSVATLEANLQKQTIKHNKLIQSLADLKSLLTRSNREASELKEKVDTKQVQLRDARNTITKLEQQFNEVSQGKTIAEQEFNDLKFKFATLKSSSDKSRSDFESNIKQSAQQVAELQSINTGLQGEVTLLLQQVQQSKDQLASSQEELSDQKSAFDLKSKMQDDLVKSLRQEVMQFKAEKINLEQQLTSGAGMKDQYMQAMEKAEELSGQVEELRIENEQLKSQQAHMLVLQQEKNALEQHVHKLKDAADSHQASLDYANQATKDAKLQVARMMTNVRNLEKEKSELIKASSNTDQKPIEQQPVQQKLVESPQQEQIIVQKSVVPVIQPAEDVVPQKASPVKAVEVPPQIQVVSVKPADPVSEGKSPVITKPTVQSEDNQPVKEVVVENKVQQAAFGFGQFSQSTSGVQPGPFSQLSQAPPALPLGFGFGSAFQSQSAQKVEVPVNKRENEGSLSPVPKKFRNDDDQDALNGDRRDSTDQFLEEVLSSDSDPVADMPSTDEEGFVKETPAKKQQPKSVEQQQKEDFIKTQSGRNIKKISFEFDDKPASAPPAKRKFDKKKKK